MTADRRHLLGMALACAVLAAPSSALAATAAVEGGTLVYSAAPGETNSIVVEPALFGIGEVSIQDSAPLTPGAGCEAISETKVDCALAGVAAAQFSLGDGDDTFTLSTLAMPLVVAGGAGNDTLAAASGPATMTGDDGGDTINGGEADDRLSGGNGNDTIHGQPGADRIDGGAGNDTIMGDRPISGTAPTGNDVITGGPGVDNISGQGGSDTIDGGPGNDSIDEEFSGANSGGGADTIAGGGGRDRVSYHFRAGTVRVSLDGRANDGQSGERDNVRPDVENITGSGGAANVLVGSSGANELRGGKRGDRLSGGGGSDRLFGFGGRDTFTGGGGNDRMYANDCGSDRLDGGPGRDRGVIDRGRLDGLISVEHRLRARC